MHRYTISLIFSLILMACLSWSSCSPKPATRQVSVSTAPMLGQEAARTELVIFSDFQCAFCKKAAREIQRLLRTHPNKLKVYFKYYPLSYHPYGQNAAQAAEAAKRQGKFWEMHDLLFAHAEALNDDLVMTLARELSLDVEKFARDMKSSEVRAKIDADKAEGDRLGLKGTPYFVINGTPFHGSYLDIERHI